MDWRQILSSLLCLLLLSGSVSGAHLHICGHEDDVSASLQVHTPQHLDLHLSSKDGTGDLDVELLAGMLKKLEQLEPGIALPTPLRIAWSDRHMLPCAGSYPPWPAGCRLLVLPPLRAPPHHLPS